MIDAFIAEAEALESAYARLIATLAATPWSALSADAAATLTLWAAVTVAQAWCHSLTRGSFG